MGGGGLSLIPISAPCATMLCSAASNTGNRTTNNTNQNPNAAPTRPAHTNAYHQCLKPRRT